MPSIIASNRAPDNIDYAAPSQFRFLVSRIPEVEFFIVAANFPQVSLSGDAEISTPFKQIAFGGDTVEFDDLSVRFLVNEDLSNYLEIYSWIIGIGFPRERKQYKDMTAYSDQTPGSQFSDASMIILSNKNNPILEITYTNVFPTALSGLDYDVQQTTVNELSATATFKFTNLNIKKIPSQNL